jgi:hypothetical protein
MLKILVDRNVEREAITHRSYLDERDLVWSNADGSSSVTLKSSVVNRERVAPRDDESFRKLQLPYLATVGTLARTKRIELFTSPELSMERMRQSGAKDGWAGFDLLSGIHLRFVDSPIDRTIVVRAHGNSSGVTADEQVAFFKSITVPRFVEMRQIIGDAHIADTFHLWTAELAELDMFLTCERRFSNVVTQQYRKLKTTVKVVTPEQLCESMNEAPTDIDALAAQHPPFN